MSIKPPEIEKPLHLSDSLAGQREGRGRTEQLDVYARLKAHQELVSSYMLTDHPQLVKERVKLTDCGSYLVFRNYFRIDLYLLRNGFFCKQHLLCLPCAFRRSGVYTHTYKLAVSHLLSCNSGWVPVLITKTVKDGADLKERYRHLANAHKALMLRRRHSFQQLSRGNIRNPTVYSHIQGGAGSFEFKRGKNSGLWHPHSHEVALMDRDAFVFTKVFRKRWVLAPLEFERRLAEEWRQLTGDSWIVEVHLIVADNAQEFHSAVAECFKYALKMGDMNPADQVAAYLALRTCRMIYSFGCLRSVEVPDESRDEAEIDLTDEPWFEEHLNWFNGQYFVHKTLDPENALFPDDPQPSRSRKKAPARKNASGFTVEQLQSWLASQIKSDTPF